MFPVLACLYFNFIVVLLSEYASKGCGKLAPQKVGTSKTYSFIDSNGYNRSYIVYLPLNYNRNSNVGYPMIHTLHGYQQNANMIQTKFLMNPNADLNNYIPIYLSATLFYSNGSSISSWNDGCCASSPGPEGPTCNTYSTTTPPGPRPPKCNDNDGNQCNWCNCLANDIAAIDQLSIIIENTFCIDMSREYVTGFSQGAILTHKIGCSLSNRFAAVAPYHGQQHIGFNCKPISDQVIGFMNIWGLSDTTVPGQSVSSDSGLYFLPVSTVQEQFATNNGCDLSDGVQNIKTVSDGIDGWKCIGWNKGCKDNGYTLQCVYNGGHAVPVKNGVNFGLNVTWNYFKQFQRNPPVSSVV